MKQLLLFLMLSFYGCNKVTQKPNIILIVADDLGYNDVSCYRNSNFDGHYENAPTSQTPNIDKIAEQGMRFTDFYCGAAVCSPSRAALITGRNATRVGIYNWIPENGPMHLRTEEITIAELLKEKNYITGHFGKWHLTSKGMNQPLPNDQGFDYSFFTYNNADPSHENPDNFYRNGQPVGQLEGYAAGLVVDEAIKWLETKKDKRLPFYMNVWFNEPHTRVAAPEKFTSRHSYNKEYYGCIENMDYAIGELINYLELNGLDKNTIIIFTSDNGSHWDHSNDPLRGEKHFNYEGGVRVPFIIRWDEKIKKGNINNFAGSFTDIFPSIASLIKTPLPTDRKYDGMDISPVFLGKKPEMDRKEPIFFYRYFHDPICMLREGDWCLLGYDELIPKAESMDAGRLGKIRPWHFMPNHMEYLKTLKPKYFELYNLKEDREQEFDLSEKYPEIVSKMKNKMIELREEMITEGGDWY
ncbi:MAG: sulfatase-like hydrolase/transferase [Bacteroidota bacterium]